MKLLIIEKPGVRIHQELCQSETAWNAIRFYEPREFSNGLKLTVPGLPNALALISDLKYFIRKYASDTLYEFKEGIYCTVSLAKSWYQSRDLKYNEIWDWRLRYTLLPDGTRTISSLSSEKKDISSDMTDDPDEYSFEVWCTPAEFEIFR